VLLLFQYAVIYQEFHFRETFLVFLDWHTCIDTINNFQSNDLWLWCSRSDGSFGVSVSG